MELFKNFILLIIENSTLEDIQSDSVNMNNILEPISILCVLDYDGNIRIVIETMNECMESFKSHIKQTCWMIILASEFIKKSQEIRKENIGKSGSNCSISHFGLESDALLCSLVFYLTQHEDIMENDSIKIALMLFFKSFTESYFTENVAVTDFTVTV